MVKFMGKQQVTFQIDKDVYRRFRNICKVRRITMTDCLKMLVRVYIAEFERCVNNDEDPL